MLLEYHFYFGSRVEKAYNMQPMSKQLKTVHYLFAGSTKADLWNLKFMFYNFIFSEKALSNLYISLNSVAYPS